MRLKLGCQVEIWKMKFQKCPGPLWFYMFVIPVFWKKRQKACQFELYSLKPYAKKKKVWYTKHLVYPIGNGGQQGEAFIWRELGRVRTASSGN